MEATENGSQGEVLVADDEDGVRESLAEVLIEAGYHVTQVADGTAAIEALNKQEFDIVISDVTMPGADGLEVLQHARRVSPQVLVLLMTAHASVETAVQALRRGAHDYLLKPILIDDALHKVQYLLRNRQAAWENQFLRNQAERRLDFDNLIGRSAAMNDVMHRVRRVAPTPTTVLVSGESGVGKEVVARAIHYFSDRRDAILLPLNCGAIPENLLESQLFGHVKGSFTGAVSSQEGLFLRARGGTIFLDEIGEMPLNLQVKILRVIESREVHPVGASTPVKVDVRVIAATNRSLGEEVEAGRFREDLFYRLNVFDIAIPPLRERREDIPALVDHFVKLHNLDLKRRFKGVDNVTMKTLMSLPWKGNVRELDNVLEHAMILGDGEWITVDDLPNAMRDSVSVPLSTSDNLREAMHSYEKSHIQTVLAKADFDKKAAAGMLGIALSSLYRKIEDLGVVDRDAE